MPQQDFADRLARLEAKAPQAQVAHARPRRPKKRWPLWGGLIVVAAVAAYVFIGSSEPAPAYDEVFTGTSKPAFQGELITFRYPDHDFQIDIPSDWREMTPEEIEEAGGSLAEADGGVDIANFTASPAGQTPELRFNIFTKRTRETDALAPVSEFQSVMSSGSAIMGRVLGFDIDFLTEPTPVDFSGLSVAETTVFHRVSTGNAVGIYRAYIVGSDLIVIYVIWEDTSIHPSAFMPILNSFRAF